MLQPTVRSPPSLPKGRACSHHPRSILATQPYSLGPNGGFFVLSHSGREEKHARAEEHTQPPRAQAMSARTLLRAWWNVESGIYSAEHSFEQHTLQWQVMHLQQVRRRLQTLRVRTMEPNTTSPVVHLDHNVGTKTRNWVMACAVAELLARRGEEVALMAQAAPSNLRLAARIDQHASRAAAFNESQVAAAAMRTLLPLLHRPRQHLATTRRRKALATVFRAAVSDLQHAESLGLIWPPPRMVPLDATAVANRWLRLTRRDEASYLDGMPLHLANCSGGRPGAHGGRGDGGGGGGGGGDGGGGNRSGGSGEGGAWDDTVLWQRWVIDGSTRDDSEGGDSSRGGTKSASKSRLVVRLASRPWLCLSVGETRAPKSPVRPLPALLFVQFRSLASSYDSLVVFLLFSSHLTALHLSYPCHPPPDMWRSASIRTRLLTPRSMCR